ncbi:MAG: glycoside hydrolase family 5 protein [Clostridia bacterium]|nr:glycoside hydrolase family 5 protein [Clostridia bacterium]
MKKLLLGVLCLIIALSMGVPAENDIRIPELNLTAKSVPENEALAFTRALGLGWNLGNTFDATGGSWIRNEMDIETAWHGERTTEALIQALKDAGFDSIRIPVSWNDHVDKDFNISKPWLDRVQKVVDWAYSRDMYVIINIHHDCDRKYYYPSEACLDNSLSYVTAIWTQLGERFKDYGERLIFENLNEPRLKDTPYEWRSDPSIPQVTASMQCINVLNQTFVDTVRAAGGNNESRYLMVSGYDAAVGGVTCDNFVLPKDSADNKLIISTHAYSPYDFALQPPTEAGSRSTWSILETKDKSELALMMNSLYDKFVSKGIPVVMGEFGSRKKGDNLSSRVEHAAFYVAVAASRGIPCFWWDNNAFSGNGELFGLIRRGQLKWEYPQIVEAMTKYKIK